MELRVSGYRYLNFALCLRFIPLTSREQSRSIKQGLTPGAAASTLTQTWVILAGTGCTHYVVGLPISVDFKQSSSWDHSSLDQMILKFLDDCPWGDDLRTTKFGLRANLNLLWSLKHLLCARPYSKKKEFKVFPEETPYSELSFIDCFSCISVIP